MRRVRGSTSPSRRIGIIRLMPIACWFTSFPTIPASSLDLRRIMTMLITPITSPDANVVITAVFEKVETAKPIERIDIDMSVIFGKLKQGFAMPKVKSNTPGVTSISIKWYKDGVLVDGNVFKDAGKYTYEFDVETTDEYKVDENTKFYVDDVLCTMEAELPERTTVINWQGSNNKAQGNLVITGTSKDQYYLVQQTVSARFEGAPSVNVYVLAQGRDNGEAIIPCGKTDTSVTVWETSDPEGINVSNPFQRRITVDKLNVLEENKETLSSQNWKSDEDSTEKEPGNPMVNWQGSSNKAQGNLVITGTSKDMYYLVQQTVSARFEGAPSVNVYVLAQGGGDNGTIKIPCGKTDTSVTVWETSDPEGINVTTPFQRRIAVDKLNVLQ